MKGVVFVEFIDMVEASFSLEVVDQIIEAAAPVSGGAYTTVGTYSHQEMLDLVGALSGITKVPVPQLIHTFGNHLLGRFVSRYPEFFAGVGDAFSFIKTIEDHIHQEVLKLYPEAELPSIQYSCPTDDVLVVTYKSTRPFADLAEGLLEACIEHFDENIQLSREDLKGSPGTHAQFILTKQ